MSERDHLVQLAAIAGSRMHRVAMRLQAAYPNPDTITQEEAQAHMKLRGHLYDENCNEPFCNKWRGMVNGAIAQMQQQGT